MQEKSISTLRLQLLFHYYPTPTLFHRCTHWYYDYFFSMVFLCMQLLWHYCNELSEYSN